MGPRYWKNLPVDVAAVEAAKAHILPDTTLLGVPGTMPEGAFTLRNPTDTLLPCSLTNVYGSGGFPAFGSGVNIGADGDPSKDCMLSSLALALKTGTVAQTINVYGNLTPWVLGVSDLCYGDQDFTLNASGCNLTGVTFALASISRFDATIDLSDNNIADIDAILNMLSTIYEVTPGTVSIDLTGGTNVGPSGGLAWTWLMVAANIVGWPVLVNTNMTIVVEDCPDTALNGVYAWDNTTHTWISGDNSIEANSAPGYGFYILKDSVQTYKAALTSVVSGPWKTMADGATSITTTLAGSWP